MIFVEIHGNVHTHRLFGALYWIVINAFIWPWAIFIENANSHFFVKLINWGVPRALLLDWPIRMSSSFNHQRRDKSNIQRRNIATSCWIPQVPLYHKQTYSWLISYEHFFSKCPRLSMIARNSFGWDKDIQICRRYHTKSHNFQVVKCHHLICHFRLACIETSHTKTRLISKLIVV